jgi:PEGA domain
MRPSRRPCIYASLALALLLAAPRAHANKLTISSSPPGARVEIDGLFAGTTPYVTDFPGGYFHKPHTVFGSRLDHAMVLRISKDGYLSQQTIITNGPLAWMSINGRRHGSYFLLKSSHFDIRLEPVSAGDGRPVESIDGEGPMRSAKDSGNLPGGRDTRSGSGTVAIVSEPRGAEIYVDGRFVGQTPSTLRLPEGLHRVEVKFSSTKKWDRDLDVLKDSKLTLDASVAPPR